MKQFVFHTLIASIVAMIGCQQAVDQHNDQKTVPVADSVKTDPLPSWKEGDTKTAIVRFISEVTSPQSPHHIPVADRIATFDNDGTLWAEQPAYFQLFFAMDRIRQLAPEHPEWKDEQPFKAVLDNDMAALASTGEHGLIELIKASHTGNTTEEFEAIVTEWITHKKHPHFNRPYTDLVYQPMLELLKYLEESQFTIFIVSAGGADFMRPWVEKVYGVPRHQTIGSSIKTTYVYENGSGRIDRLAELDVINDNAGKPVAIHRFIGRKPVFASGNSDGDLQMLQWTESGNGKRFMLYVHHTDSLREWAYDRNSSIGRLDKGLDEAHQKGWTIADMERDWKIIFPFELDSN